MILFQIKKEEDRDHERRTKKFSKDNSQDIQIDNHQEGDKQNHTIIKIMVI